MNNPFQNKLLNYEGDPPSGVWNKIESSLNDTSILQSQNLYDFEAAPPAFVWEKINEQLDKPSGEQAKVVPFFRRYRKPLKYSGAMAFFIFAAIVVSLFISKKTISETPVTNSANRFTKHTTTIDEVKKKRNQAIYNSEFNSTSKTESISPETNEIVAHSFTSGKYIIVTDAEGNAIRLSKKIYGSFACPVNNFNCKERLKKLKEKFASSAVTSDFMGILKILKTLQENQ